MPSDNVKNIIQELMHLLEMQSELFNSKISSSLTDSQLEEHRLRYLRIRELTAQLEKLEKKT